MKNFFTHHQAPTFTEVARDSYRREPNRDLCNLRLPDFRLSDFEETVFDSGELFAPAKATEESCLLDYPVESALSCIERLPEVLSDVRAQVDRLFSRGQHTDSTTLHQIESFCRQSLGLNPQETVGVSKTDLHRMRDILVPSDGSLATSMVDSSLYLLVHGEPVDFDALASALWSAVYVKFLHNVNATIVVPGGDLSSLGSLSKRLHGVNLIDLLTGAGFHLISTTELQQSWSGEERIVMVDSHEQHDNRLLRQTRGLPIAGAIDAHTSQVSASSRVFTSTQVRATASLIYTLVSSDLQTEGRGFTEVIESPQGAVAAAISILGVYTDCAMDNGLQNTAQKGDLAVMGALLNSSLKNHPEIIDAFSYSQRKREEEISRAVEDSSLYRAFVTFDGRGFFVINPQSLLIKLGDDLLGPIAERLRRLYPHLSEVWVLAQHSDSEGRGVWRLAARAENEVAGVDRRIKEILGSQNAGGYRTAGAGTVIPELFPSAEFVELKAVPLMLVDELQRRCLAA